MEEKYIKILIKIIYGLIIVWGIVELFLMRYTGGVHYLFMLIYGGVTTVVAYIKKDELRRCELVFTLMYLILTVICGICIVCKCSL